MPTYGYKPMIMIHNRCDLLFHVILNETLLWEFLEVFGQKFAYPIVDEFGTHSNIRSVLGYGSKDAQEGTVYADVQVAIGESDQFKLFLTDFAHRHNQVLQTH